VTSDPARYDPTNRELDNAIALALREVDAWDARAKGSTTYGNNVRRRALKAALDFIAGWSSPVHLDLESAEMKRAREWVK
jgi:hypothetical protein